MDTFPCLGRAESRNAHILADGEREAIPREDLLDILSESSLPPMHAIVVEGKMLVLRILVINAVSWVGDVLSDEFQDVKRHRSRRRIIGVKQRSAGRGG
jgi:hypothetical protein